MYGIYWMEYELPGWQPPDVVWDDPRYKGAWGVR